MSHLSRKRCGSPLVKDEGDEEPEDWRLVKIEDDDVKTEDDVKEDFKIIFNAHPPPSNKPGIRTVNPSIVRSITQLTAATKNDEENSIDDSSDSSAGVDVKIEIEDSDKSESSESSDDSEGSEKKGRGVGKESSDISEDTSSDDSDANNKPYISKQTVHLLIFAMSLTHHPGNAPVIIPACSRKVTKTRRNAALKELSNPRRARDHIHKARDHIRKARNHLHEAQSVTIRPEARNAGVLQGQVLTNRTLTDLVLQGCTVSNTRCFRCTLQGCTLFNSPCTDSTLQGCIISNSSLGTCAVQGGTLTNSTLRGGSVVGCVQTNSKVHN